MNGRARARLIGLLQGFWLVPGLIATGIGLLALVVVSIDRHAGATGVGFAFDGDATAARTILSTIAGSLITVAGLAFSITVVTLQLVSSQFTPRALKSFLGDRINQVTAGAFVGIFLYCLLVLRSVRTAPAEGSGFIPALGVTLAIVLAVIALGFLLAFIHHISSSIQVSNITARIARQTLSRVEKLYPSDFGEALEEDTLATIDRWASEGPSLDVRPDRPGFVQVIDVPHLQAALEGSRVLIRVAPGDFITPGTVMVSIWEHPTDEGEVAEAIRSGIRIDNERDLTQDAGYGIRQITDIALRALSPGINDPTTAINCIGYLQAIMERLVVRDMPDEVRHNAEHEIVFIARHRTFHEYIADAFIEVGRYAHDDARVAVALIDALASIGRLAEKVGISDRVTEAHSAARDIAAPAIEAAGSPSDERLIAEHLARVTSPS